MGEAGCVEKDEEDVEGAGDGLVCGEKGEYGVLGDGSGVGLVGCLFTIIVVFCEEFVGVILLL